jgi:hypothetical protein
MTDTLLDIPPPPNQRITQIFIWVMINEDGGESIMSHDMPMEEVVFGTRHMPLMSSKRDVAQKLRPIAEHICSLASTERGHPVACVMRSFWS